MDDKIKNTEFFLTITEDERIIKSRVAKLNIDNLFNDIETQFRDILMKKKWYLKLFNEKYSEYEDIEFEEIDRLKNGGKMRIVVEKSTSAPESPPTSANNSQIQQENDNESSGVGR